MAGSMAAWKANAKRSRLNDLFPQGPGPQSPGELYMAFGPEHRVVKVRPAGSPSLFLAHVVRGEDRLWRQDCEAAAYIEDADGASLYQALRALIDACPVLGDLEP
jgi:hypothetical protein